jgi:hypothetical protein
LECPETSQVRGWGRTVYFKFRLGLSGFAVSINKIKLINISNVYRELDNFALPFEGIGSSLVQILERIGVL